MIFMTPFIVKRPSLVGCLKSERLNSCLFGFRTEIYVWNLNKFVRISDVLVVRTDLERDDGDMYEIRTCSDFGRLLYKTKVKMNWRLQKFQFISCTNYSECLKSERLVWETEQKNGFGFQHVPISDIRFVRFKKLDNFI